LADTASAVTNAVTFNNGGSGDASGTTFNGGAARTISYNTFGAMPTTGGTFSGPVTFTQPVTFSGTATYVLSTNTWYTDNIIELHVPPAGVNAPWFADDGKDIGLRFHYYANSTDTNAALVLDATSKYLDWYSAGAESAVGDFSSATYGVFRSGSIKLVSGTSNSGNTTTGDLTVLGGVGVGGGAFFGGIVTATNFSGSLSGGTAMSLHYQSAANTTAFLAAGSAGQILQTNSTGSAPSWVSVTGLTAGNATTATNIAAGTAGQLHYQSAPGTTAFVSTATTGNFLQANFTGAPTWTGTGSMYVNRATLSDTSTNAATAYSTIGSHSAGTGLTGSAFNGSANQTWTLNTATLMASAVSAINLSAGSAMALPYQSASGTTAFLAASTSGYILQTNSTGTAPTWVAPTGLSAGSVANALTINNGGAGAASGATFNGSAAVTISYNTIGASLASQSAVGSGTQYNSIVSFDTRGYNYLPGERSAGLFADFKTNTTDSLVDGGTYHGVLTFRPYGTSNTDFTGGNAQQIATTDNNNLWHRMSATSSTWGTWYKIIDTGNTGTAYVNRAVIADSASGGSAQVNTIQQTANANYYPTFVDTNNATATAETVYTTSTLVVNPGTGQVGIGTASLTGSVRLTIAGGGVHAQAVAATGSADSYADAGGLMMSYVGGIGYIRSYSNTSGTGTTNIAFQTAGIEQLRIDSSGNVGIGTSSPNTKLDVVGAKNVAAINITQTAPTVANAFDDYVAIDFRMYNEIYPALQFTGNPSARISSYLEAGGNIFGLDFWTRNGAGVFGKMMRLTGAGGLSFGATGTAYGSSGQVLQSNGNASPTWVTPSTLASASATNADNIRTVATPLSAAYYPTFVDSNNASNAYELVYTTSSFQINPANGQINIGSTGIDYPPSSGGNHTLRLNAVNTSSIGFHDSGSTIGNIKFSGVYGFEIGAGDGLYGPHNTVLYGNVGVGLQTLTEKFEVNGSINVSTASSNNFATGNQRGFIDYVPASTQVRVGHLSGASGSTTGILTLLTNGTERVRIDSSGNVGVGTTTPAARLDIVSAGGASGGLQVSLAGEAYGPNTTSSRSSIYDVAGTIVRITALNNSTASGALINFNAYNAAGGATGAFAGAVSGSTGNGPAHFVIGRRSAVQTWAETFRITQNGGVSFGTSGTAVGTSGQVLQSNGDAAPTWVNASTLASASATNADNIKTISQAANVNYYPTFVSANNATAAYMPEYTTSTFYVNPSTGALYAGLTANRIDSRINIDKEIYYSMQRNLEEGSGTGLSLGTGTAPTVVTNTSTSIPFGKVLSYSAYAEHILDEFIPVHPGEILYGEIWAFRANGATGTAGGFYCGVSQYDSSKLPIATNIGLNYFIASGVTIPTTGVWTKYSGTISLATSHTPFSGSDGGPVRYVKPYLIINYTAGTIPTQFVGLVIRRTNLYRDSGNVVFNGGGSVGVGITTPIAKLQSSGAAQTTSPTLGSATGAALYLTNTDTAYGLLAGVASSGNAWLQAQRTDSGTSAYNLNLQPSGGSVGIGNSSPTSTLDIYGLQSSSIANSPTGTLRLAYAGGPVANTTGSSIVFTQQWFSGSPTAQVAVGQITGVKIAGDGNFGGGLTFWTSNATANNLAERLRITNNGGFSFGASGTAYGTSGQILQSNGDGVPTWVNQSTIAAGSSPLTSTYVGFGSGSNLLTGSSNLTYASSILNVAYQNTFNATTPGFGTYGIHLNGQTTADYATGITFSAGSASAANANAGIYSQGSGSYGTKMYFATTDSYAVGSKTRMMIDQAGNVGIGTITPGTPLAFTDSLGAKIQFNGNNANGYQIGLASSVNGGDAMMKITAGITGAGEIGFYNTTNLRVLINNAGNVGIGVTGPSHKVDVSASTTYSYAQGSYSSGATLALRAGGTSANDYSGIRFVNSNGSREAFFGVVQGATNNVGDFVFQTYNGYTTSYGERMRVQHNGNVVIGASGSTSTNKFEVQGTAGQLFSVSDSFTGTVFAASDVSGIPSIEVLDTGLVKFAQYNGSVAISTGTAVSGSALSVYGIISTIGSASEIRGAGEITAYYSSDERLKENVSVISNPIEIVKQIRGVFYDWTDEQIARRGGEDGYFVRKHDIGVIAQEVERVLPEIVVTRDDGYKAVRYEKLVPLLIESIKSQQADIDMLKAEIENLKKIIK
jgi:hypothetical protein